MTTMCECGHALSQHPERGRCDYSGYACRCQKYKRHRVDNPQTGAKNVLRNKTKAP